MGRHQPNAFLVQSVVNRMNERKGRRENNNHQVQKGTRVSSVFEGFGLRLGERLVSHNPDLWLDHETAHMKNDSIEKEKYCYK